MDCHGVRGVVPGSPLRPCWVGIDGRGFPLLWTSCVVTWCFEHLPSTWTHKQAGNPSVLQIGALAEQ